MIRPILILLSLLAGCDYTCPPTALPPSGGHTCHDQGCSLQIRAMHGKQPCPTSEFKYEYNERGKLTTLLHPER
jgi:hypothetical protein